MRADADFMVYVAARWPYLVKEAVLLGVPPDRAAAATTDALSRCRGDWDRASREENVDALVQAELRLAARRHPATPEADRQRLADELLVLAPPTLEELQHQQHVNNRATLRRAAWVVVPLLLGGIGLGVYLGTSGDPASPSPDNDALEPAAASLEENPVPGVVWYADGRLHLDHTVLAVDGLRDMTRIGNGVVYGDDEGRVVYAADDGTRDVLGHKDPAVPVAATDETAWAAWVETGGDRPTLDVVEADTGNELASIAVSSGTEVVAVDGTSVFYIDAAGGHELVPGTEQRIRPVSAAGLLDARSRVRAYQVLDDTIEVVQPNFSVAYQLPGEGAQLSSDGNLVATRLPGSGEPVLYDARSGLAVPTGVPDGDHVVAVAPGRRLTVTYVVAPGHQSLGHELELRTCQVGDRPGEETVCSTRAQLSDTGGSPVLAR
jgi:hypothetical protein